MKENWWGSQLTDMTDDSTNSEPGTMKGHIIHVGEDGGVIRGADEAEYNFEFQDILANPHGKFGRDFVTWEVMFVPERGKAKQIIIVRVGVVESKVITLDGEENEKEQIIAGILAILFGGVGAHKFYLGYNTQGIIMLLMGTIGWMFIVPPLATFLIGFIEGVIYLTKNEQEFYDTYEAKKRPWF